MFSGFMTDAWIVASLAALVGGAVGFFVVLRGSAFAAHAIPNGSFAGAAAATLAGVNPLIGLGVFSLAGALAIGGLGRRGRREVATALTLVFMLGLGALLLGFSDQYASQVYSLLFGQLLGISSAQLAPTAGLAAACLLALALLYRRLLLTSLIPEPVGLRASVTQMAFLVLLALATTLVVPVVGTTLMFSLMVGPPAAARTLTARPPAAIALSVCLALALVWAALALSYETDWPVGFFVGVGSGLIYATARGWGWGRARLGAGRAPVFGPSAPRGA